MGKIALVGIEVETGSKILKILDDAGLQVKVALWAFLAEYEDWRIVMSSRKFDAAGFDRGLWAPPRCIGCRGFHLSGKAKNFRGIRIYGQRLGDRFVENGYAYRIS
jgi:hypothetical protein